MAYVTLKHGVETSADEIIKHCHNVIPGYKKPRFLHIIDALPLNSANKVAKPELSRMAWEDMAAGLG